MYFKHNHFHNLILTILYSSNTFRGRRDRSSPKRVTSITQAPSPARRIIGRRVLGYPPSSHTHRLAHVGRSYRPHRNLVGAGLRTGYKFFQPSFTSLPPFGSHRTATESPGPGNACRRRSTDRSTSPLGGSRSPKLPAGGILSLCILASCFTPLPSRANIEPREVRLVWCRLPLPLEDFLDDFQPVFCRLEKDFTTIVLG